MIDAEEKLLIVDENDNVLGEAFKKEIHKNRQYHRQICLIIRNSKKQLLLQKRNKKKLFDPDCWTSAVTGHVVLNDTYEHTLLKETREEIGLELDMNEITYLGKILTFSDQNGELCGGPTSIYQLEKDIQIENLNKEDTEVSDLAYFEEELIREHVLKDKPIYIDGELQKFADDFYMVIHNL